MAEQHDVRRGFFIFAEHAVMVSVKHVKDRLQCRLAMAVLENLNVGIFRETLLKTP
jgi:hypothetical protein